MLHEGSGNGILPRNDAIQLTGSWDHLSISGMQRRRVPQASTRPKRQQERTAHDDANVAVVLKRHTGRATPWLRVFVAVVFTIGITVITLRSVDDSVPRDTVVMSGDSRVDTRTTEFLAWFRDAGGHVSDQISIKAFAGMGRGVVARKPIQEHDQLLFIPMDIIMCHETIRKQLRGDRELLSKFEKLREIPEEMLTAFLVMEQWKNSSSFWYPYLRMLPQYDESRVLREVSSPLFFESSGDLDELQDERMQIAAAHERQRLMIALQRFRRLFKHYLPDTLSSSTLVDATYRWARFLINSRAFTIRGDRFLVPFGDVFNGRSQSEKGRSRDHANGVRFLDYHRLRPGRGMEIRADRVVQNMGSQVFEDYGDNDNYIYFLHHGFLMEPNPFDCVSVRLPELPAHDPLRDIKLRILHDSGITARDGSNAVAPLICVSSDGHMTNPQDDHTLKLYTPLIEMKADAEAESVLKKCAKRELSQTVCFGHSSADEVDNLVGLAIEKHLARYSTTLVQDLTSLSTMPNNTREFGLRHALHFRISRKIILTTALAHIQRRQATRRTRLTRTQHHLSRPEEEDKSPEARIARFESWIATFTPDINHVELKYVNPSMGYGAFATKSLQKGEIYLSVPTEVIMDVHSAMRSPFILNLLTGSHGNMRWVDSQILLMLHLLHEKYNTNGSLWAPYLDLLPHHDRLASPLFYSAGSLDLELLDTAAPSDIAFLIHQYRRRVDADFEQLRNQLSPFPDWITLERFRWASAILDSRSIWWGGNRHLVPLLDMVNCFEIDRDHDPHATKLNADGDAAVTKSSWEFRVGDQIVENYAQPNYIYLLYHGFVLSENSHDCAHFHFELDEARRMPPQDPARRTVIDIIERLQTYTWSVDVCVGSQHQDINTSTERLLRLALIYRSPQRAAQLHRHLKGKLTKDHVDAAKKETQDRLIRLQRAIEKYEDKGTLDRAVMANTFVKTQHQHMETLYRYLDDVEVHYSDV